MASAFFFLVGLRGGWGARAVEDISDCLPSDIPDFSRTGIHRAVPGGFPGGLVGVREQSLRGDRSRG